MGYGLVIPKVSFGLSNADILTNGSLLLIEPGDLANGWDGVPANGAAIPNLAGDLASDVVGGDASNLLFSNTMGTSGRVERSARGGLHVAENWGAGAVGNNVQLLLPSASPIRTYLAAHLDHSIYVADWARITRPGDASQGGTIFHTLIGSVTLNRAALGVIPSTGQLAGAPGSADARRLGFTSDETDGNAYQSIGAAGVPSGLTTHGQPIYRAGPNGANQVDKSAGILLWWLYVEDLTVSGRTYAQVEAKVHAYYTQQVLTAGGRYNGDTYTAPA